MGKVTIKDVAKECNVSTQTISRVINDSDNVKESTRTFVMKKIKEMGYKPNLYAKNLSWKRNKNILVSIRRVKGMSATIWTNILVNEIFSCNKDKDISIFMEQYYEDEELKNSLLNTSATFIDGAIIFYEKEGDKRIELLKKANIPFIMVGKSYSDNNVYVSTDDFNTTFKGIEYLFSKNINEIAFITANPTPLNIERKNGVIAAYTKNRISEDKLIIIEGINTRKETYKVVTELAKNKRLPQAFFVSGDEKAVAVLKALNDLNIRIPEEVSVLGLDNIPISEHLYPALTTLGLDYIRIAERVYEKLCNMMEGMKEISEEIECSLIERDSVKK